MEGRVVCYSKYNNVLKTFNVKQLLFSPKLFLPKSAEFHYNNKRPERLRQVFQAIFISIYYFPQISGCIRHWLRLSTCSIVMYSCSSADAIKAL